MRDLVVGVVVMVLHADAATAGSAAPQKDPKIPK